jgi:predicted O-methyltransferase YrrM
LASGGETVFEEEEELMSNRIVNALKNPQTLRNFVRWHGLNAWIGLRNAFTHSEGAASRTPEALKELQEIRTYAATVSDISDHLVTLFAAAVRRQPRLIVELGVRGGDSTFVLQRAANLCGCRLLSLDIEDCSAVNSDPNWLFVKADDVAFAGEFADYCAAHQLPGEIDVLFIDTSHLYDHTVQEIAHWFPLLSERATVMFHDTNLREVGRHRNGKWMRGTDNQRGVIGPLENYLGIKFDEGRDFVGTVGSWLITHYAFSNGFTILERLPGLSNATKEKA